MSLKREVIDTVLNFYPSNVSKDLRVEFGEVSGGVRLVHDIFPYQLRVRSLEGREPLVLQWTKQPVLALVREGAVRTLAYATDIRAIGEELAVKVADRLNIERARQV